MSFRFIFMGIGSVLLVLAMFLSDPDSGLIQNLPVGGGTIATLLILALSILYVGVLHLSRKALLDYIKLEEFFKSALRTPEGSGLALCGVGLIMISVSIVIYAATS